MDRIPPMEDKWGLHPISAEALQDEPPGEASTRQDSSAAGASAEKSRSGSSAGALQGAPRLLLGDTWRSHGPGGSMPDLFRLLAATGPHAGMDENRRLYAPFIGSWEVDATW